MALRGQVLPRQRLPGPRRLLPGSGREPVARAAPAPVGRAAAGSCIRDGFVRCSGRGSRSAVRPGFQAGAGSRRGGPWRGNPPRGSRGRSGLMTGASRSSRPACPRAPRRAGQLLAQPVGLGEVALPARLLAQVDERLDLALSCGSMAAARRPPPSSSPSTWPASRARRRPAGTRPPPRSPCATCSRAVWSSRARSNSTPSACGVLKSSSMAASNRARWAATWSKSPPSGPGAGVPRRRCAPPRP